MGRLLDGKRIAGEIRGEVAASTSKWKEQGIEFKLTVVLVGDHPASASYVRTKERVAGEVGIAGEVLRLPDSTTEAELLTLVQKLNQDESVDGILVQLPLPAHHSELKVLEAIDPLKDVDGFHPMNAGRNFIGLPTVWPCTPAGIMEMLERENIEVKGKRAVVVGRSNIVGKPMAMLLLQANATVTICHSQTKDLASLTREADILVAAVGSAHLIGKEYVKQGAVVIDVGMNRLEGKLTGDVDFEAVLPVAGAITPVPGGVGPLTVAMLMKNTVSLGTLRRGLGGRG
ncbi:bifunctional methylenetetrahydrofolate dehydrogenase/methenyltetrahydrofolate cyclohydrolase FolD [Alicyclobacillus tolerans]|uniref:bifunctional methylenetetrahydrofolate dehydrogenase/methenyltetrahydrofolate cyclohydrolase FolD n=1 Tax=Alicyclobacillus tolerans TaxID=90970 RepID=UPI001F01777E|nr:bifunctional methylenetetrahydrofolate dehydrogenase/methenyltetrahydrofolate cyclohydrolase FolD [Alicyclobacillus tolerans]MCF8563599.1 bifunctional methylenetetrahydrofolate dehydrogenase/methenyltetrahydrofolate cyclohydrolase FolD [Alicyclobacillus tolerans]